MEFDAKKIEVYKELLLTTQLQAGYQEFIKLLRYIRILLENELDSYEFSKSVVENHMEFSYFQLFNKELKEKGLKVQVVFVHKEFQFEVWVSGYNRKIQCAYYNQLRDVQSIYLLNDNPMKVNYIFKACLSNELDISNADLLISLLKEEILNIIEFSREYMLSDTILNLR